MIQLTDEQWERIRHYFPEEHIPDGRAASPENTRTGHREDGGAPSASSGNYEPEGSLAPLVTINAALGRRFLRLANLDSGEFERLSRYETAVWRQVNNSSSRSICCGVDDDSLGFAR